MVYSDFDPISGISTVILQKGEYFFEGEVQLHEEDVPYASSYAGCAFAEIKAEIEYMKFKVDAARDKLKTLQILYSQMEDLKEFSAYKHSRPVRHLRKQVHMAQKDLDTAKTDLQALKDFYPVHVEKRLLQAKFLKAQIEASKNIKELGLCMS